MAGVAWVNGKILSADRAAIAPADRGFMYGEGLFETMRAYQGKVFRLGRHLERLAAAAPELGLTPPAREVCERAVAEALAASGIGGAAVRLTVTPGLADAGSPTLVVVVRALTLPPPEQYASGCRAITVASALTVSALLRRVKSLNYLDKLLAQRRAEQAGGDEAILCDPDGCVAEAAMRNIFAVLTGDLVTPPLSRGILPGITREAVLEVAAKAGLRCHERDLQLGELIGADECFLTSSLAEVLPVASIDGRPLTGSPPGPVTRMLVEAYRALVSQELAIPTG